MVCRYLLFYIRSSPPLTTTTTTLVVTLSHNNNTTIVVLPNRDKWTLILGAIYGISTIHSYIDGTAFITLQDNARLSLPLLPRHAQFSLPLLLYVNDSLFSPPPNLHKNV